MIIIRLLANARTGDVPVKEYWLKSYDVDARGGLGEYTATDDPAEALRFDDLRAATAAWKTQSRVRPLRADGQPNRPLTAFTVLFDDADDPGGL